MKLLSFAIGAVALALLPAPAAAQLGNDSVTFVEALRKGDGAKAKGLLDEKGSILVNARDYSGNTALVSVITNEDDQWTGYLLSLGADPNLPAAGGETPLIAATRVGFEQAVEWLLSKGAKVDGTNKMGETPLIIAVQQRQPALVRVLLEAGANPDKTDSAAGLSARDYATRDARSRNILKLIQSAKPKAAAAAAR
jgi:ankyrin repeat protein